jgi:hypothetical protein
MAKQLQTRTWPYGTTKRVKVLNAVRNPRYVGLICHCDEDGEGYVLTMRRPFYEEVQDGDAGTITFKEGGPTGGYWEFTGDGRP